MARLPVSCEGTPPALCKHILKNRKRAATVGENPALPERVHCTHAHKVINTAGFSSHGWLSLPAVSCVLPAAAVINCSMQAPLAKALLAARSL
jgi:hypothetical protein